MKSTLRNGSLFILCGALITGSLWNGGYFQTSKWVLTFLILGAAVWELVVSIAEGSQVRSLRSPALWLLAVFAIFATGSLFWSVVPGDTEREAALLLAYVAVIFVVRSNLGRSGAAALAVISAWFVYVASFVSAWGVVTYIFRLAPWAGLLDNIYRAGSSFEYSNALACFGLMALPVSAALHRRAGSNERPVYATAMTLQAAAVLLSFSRFGIVALLLMALYLCLTGRRENMGLCVFLSFTGALAVAVTSVAAQEYQHMLVGLAVVALMLAGFFILQRVAGQAAISADGPSAAHVHGLRNDAEQSFAGKSGSGIDNSAVTGALVAGAAAVVLAAFMLIARMDRLRVIITTRFEEGLTLRRLLPHRLDTWAGSVEAFRADPLVGSGLGSFYHVYQEHALAAYTKYAHNLVLQTAVETGWVGAVLLTAFLVYVAALICLRLLAKIDPVIKAYAISCGVFIAFNLFDWEWYVPALTAWFMLSVACIEGYTRMADEEKRNEYSETLMNHMDDATGCGNENCSCGRSTV